MYCDVFIFVKQKTAYEMRISDWSSDVCSSDLSSRSGIARPGCSTPSTSSRGGVPSPASCRTWITRQLCAGSTGCWGNVKNALHGTYHALRPKYMQRYLSEFCYRFNRRFELSALVPRFLHAAAHTPSLPYKLDMKSKRLNSSL